MRLLGFFYYCILLIGCQHQPVKNGVPFLSISPDQSGINFSNTLVYNERLNTYTYRNFYNGAGVALGDINNDGLLDIYFSGNQVDNKLYLNKGNFTFEDITEKAGVKCSGVWSTGVSMADINGDGLLDIFVCKSGPPMGGIRHNELFINNGDLTFREESEKWGVADEGLSIHAVFFDYDKDGDLDFYLLNNSNRSVGIYDLKEGQREIRDPFGGNKLYRNEGDRFTDVSEAAGIYGSAIGFGLGVTVSDVNKDGWQDIFVSNDFFERDYLYMNNQNGTFTEALEEYITEISMGSMGADIADLNNDGYPEIYVTEMLPEPLERIRTKTIFEDWDKYSANVSSGYYHQFTRNVLQLNNGPIPGNEKNVSFSEISRFAKVHATDWSWGALIFDYNNDGYKDIFVANGIAKDLTDQDYINFEANTMLTASNLKKDSLLLTKLIDKIPSVPIKNYLFENRQNNSYLNIAETAGLDFAGFSNGAAYGDLDNDGFLDLVVNNINSLALVYKNQMAQLTKNNFIQIELKGKGLNSFAMGTQVTAYCGNHTYYVEQSPVRGYLSSVDSKVHLGLSDHKTIDSLQIRWPDGFVTILKHTVANQLLIVDEAQVKKSKRETGLSGKDYYFSPKHSDLESVIHAGSTFIDFDRDRLLFEMISNESPGLAIADVNNDGLDDVFLCGAVNQAGSLWLQGANGKFINSNQAVFKEDQKSEDTKALFFDANGDGNIDLYVASGGNHFSYGAPELRDRLYINDGYGNFKKSAQILVGSDLTESTAFVVNLDFDKDGHEDLLVGSRLIPFYYGFPANAYLLRNSGDGKFTNVTIESAPDFLKLGLLRDAIIADYDRDGDLDIIMCGEWMGIKIFENSNGHFTDVSTAMGFENTDGLWNTIKIGDFNRDGYHDIVVGNHGLNSRFTASVTNPLKLYVNDFDSNGSPEHIICHQIEGKEYPVALLPELWKQMPSVKKIFQTYGSYEHATVTDIFDKTVLAKSSQGKVSELKTTLFLNELGKHFKQSPLPSEVQFTKIYTVGVVDINGDGNQDFIFGGNQRRAKPERGIQDAGYGVVVIGNGDGTFSYCPPSQSGILIRGEIRDIQTIHITGELNVIFSRFNDNVKIYKINTRKNDL